MAEEKKNEKGPKTRSSANGKPGKAGRPPDTRPAKKPRAAGKDGPGPKKNSIRTMPSNFDKVIYLKMTDPRQSNGDIAKKLGLDEGTVSNYLTCAEGKRMMGQVKERVIDRIQDKISDLIEQAVDTIPEILAGKTKKGESLMIRADMVKFLLRPVIDKMGSEGVADEVEFEVVIQGDGTITNKMTRKRKGQEI